MHALSHQCNTHGYIQCTTTPLTQLNSHTHSHSYDSPPTPHAHTLVSTQHTHARTQCNPIQHTHACTQCNPIQHTHACARAHTHTTPPLHSHRPCAPMHARAHTHRTPPHTRTTQHTHSRMQCDPIQHTHARTQFTHALTLLCLPHTHSH
jgi:hypothetical protein